MMNGSKRFTIQDGIMAASWLNCLGAEGSHMRVGGVIAKKYSHRYTYTHSVC